MKPGFELLIFLTMMLVITTVAWFDDPQPVRAQHPAGRVVELKERYFYSRTCPDSHWFVERVEDISVTVECDYVEEDQ